MGHSALMSCPLVWCTLVRLQGASKGVMRHTVSVSWHKCDHLRLESWTAVKVQAPQVQQPSHHLCSAVCERSGGVPSNPLLRCSLLTVRAGTRLSAEAQVVTQTQ